MSLLPCSILLDSECDVVVFVNDGISALGDGLCPIERALMEFLEINPKLENSLTILPFPEHPCKRLIFSPTGKLNKDTSDSRNISDAAAKAFKEVHDKGFRKPLLVLGNLKTGPEDAVWMDGDFPLLNAILGAMHSLYQPIELLEANPPRGPKCDALYVFRASERLLEVAFAMEEGRRVARDIAASDPERMSPGRVVEYIQKELASSPEVKISVQEVDQKAYPLMAAVNRAASGVERHKGKVVHMKYTGGASVDTTLFMVGKGITYDTGGADIKAGGVMAGMSRDKGGAAAIAGFFKTLSLLKPQGICVNGSLALVRNSVGSNCYVADEIITSRAGVRVRVGNTDAEGRMVMADLLCEAKEQAVDATNPFLFTIATLTGHAIRAYKCYTAVMDNGPAAKHGIAHKLQNEGNKVSDMVEVSTIRREDYEMVAAPSEYEDVLQCNNKASSDTPRGHQLPAAFMIAASGLDKHGLDSETKQVPYTHLDIAGSSGFTRQPPTGAPLLMFTSMFVLPRI